MQDNTGHSLERAIKKVHQVWQSRNGGSCGSHPDEETAACFEAGLLSEEERVAFQRHVAACPLCTEVIGVAFAVRSCEGIDLPEALSERIRAMAGRSLVELCAEIFLDVRDKTLEILSTTADVLVDQEVIPGAILRSRQVRDFSDEVTILKDFHDLRIEVKIVAKGQGLFDVGVAVKEMQTQTVVKDIRVRLVLDGVELESYALKAGSVCFEQVKPGRYSIEIVPSHGAIAVIFLQIQEGQRPLS